MSYGTNGASSAQAVAYPRDTGPVPNLPIPNALATLSQSISEMGMVADSLVARLGGVLSPSYPRPDPVTNERAQIAAAPPPTSQCTDDLLAYARRVQNIGTQLQDALSRLEV